MPQSIGELAAKLENLLKLRSIPFGMKLFERRGDMEAIPKIRRPKSVHTLDQVVAQASRLGSRGGAVPDAPDQCEPQVCTWVAHSTCAPGKNVRDDQASPSAVPGSA